MRYEPISLYLVKPATWEQFGWGITVLKDVQLHLPCLVTRILNRIGHSRYSARSLSRLLWYGSSFTPQTFSANSAAFILKIVRTTLFQALCR